MEGKRWQNGKSYHKYTYTVKDIAEITGRSLGTIRNDMSAGKINMDDLLNVMQYIVKFNPKIKRASLHFINQSSQKPSNNAYNDR